MCVLIRSNPFTSCRGHVYTVPTFGEEAEKLISFIATHTHTHFQLLVKIWYKLSCETLCVWVGWIWQHNKPSDRIVFHRCFIYPASTSPLCSSLPNKRHKAHLQEWICLWIIFVYVILFKVRAMATCSRHDDVWWSCEVVSHVKFKPGLRCIPTPSCLSAVILSLPITLVKFTKYCLKRLNFCSKD